MAKKKELTPFLKDVDRVTAPLLEQAKNKGARTIIVLATDEVDGHIMNYGTVEGQNGAAIAALAHFGAAQQVRDTFMAAASLVQLSVSTGAPLLTLVKMLGIVNDAKSNE